MTVQEKEFRYNCILVVDDSNIDLYVAEQILKSMKGASKIIIKQSAIEALEYLTQHKDSFDALPELILLDIQMPGMDGFAFLEEYKKLPKPLQKHCKVIMLSSTVDPYDSKRINENPIVEGFVSKPLNKDSLKNLFLSQV